MAVQRLTREESQARTRERLIDAARAAFARGGYAGASVDVIAAEAGYSKGAFYSNFESKEAIFLELLSRHMAAEAEQLRRLVEGGTTAAEVMSSIDRWLDTLNKDADWPLLAMELLLHARRQPVFAAAYDTLNIVQSERLGDLVTQLFKMSGRKLPRPAAEIGRALMALTHGLVLQRSQGQGEADPVGPLVKLVLHSLIDAAPKL